MRTILLSFFLFLILPCFANPDSLLLYKIFASYDDFRTQENKQLYRQVLPDDQKHRAIQFEGWLEELSQINRKNLNHTDEINLLVFEYVVKNWIDFIRNEMYLIPFNAEGGFYNELAGVVRRTQISNEKEAEQYRQKLSAFPAYMRNNMQLMRIGLKKKMVAPKLIAKNYQGLIAPFISSDSVQNILYHPITSANAKEVSSWREFAGHIEQIITDSIIPIYQVFDRFMRDEYLPRARNSVGISNVPRGKEIYEQRIAYFTSLDMTPDEVFAIGETEVKRIESEMLQIIADLNFKGSFSDFIAFLRSDPQFYVSTPRELLMEASYIAKKVDGMLPQYFKHLPRLPYGVQPVPAALAPNYTGGRYSGGSWEKQQAGNYWVNTYKLESRPLYVLPALTLHEAVPGHHLQIALAQELEGLPSFRNREYISAFGEGWALYTEWLGKEMGIYETPYQDFGRLTYEMWRACRLVVDVGLHHKNWTREQAFNYLAEHTALSLHECNTEIDRYIGWPGQAVSYKIGELKIRELRRKAEAALGNDFDLRTFHDVLLRNGSVPLFILEKEVDDLIRSTMSP